jgi:hypothetical protein
VIHVPIRAPPRTAKLNEQSPAEQLIITPLEQLWTRLPSQSRQEVLQRFALMIAQQLADHPLEASDE